MQGNRSTYRTIKILQLLAKNQKGLTLSEISERLDIPVSSTSDILNPLLKSKMIELTDERGKAYGIGPTSYYIGTAFTRNNSFLDIAKQEIDLLGEKLNKTIFLGQIADLRVVYIYKYEPDDLVVATCDIGSSNDLYCTALGKSVLAYDDDLLNEVLKEVPMVKKAKNTITTEKDLRDDLALVRKRGYAIDNLEQKDYFICIGAPIFDGNGKAIAAVSATSYYLMDIDVEKEAEEIKNVADRISQKLGHH